MSELCQALHESFSIFLSISLPIFNLIWFIFLFSNLLSNFHFILFSFLSFSSFLFFFFHNFNNIRKFFFSWIVSSYFLIWKSFWGYFKLLSNFLLISLSIFAKVNADLYKLCVISFLALFIHSNKKKIRKLVSICQFVLLFRS